MPLDISHYPTTITGLTEREQIADALNRVLYGLDHDNAGLFRSGWSSKAEPSFVFQGQEPMLGIDAIFERCFNVVSK